MYGGTLFLLYLFIDRFSTVNINIHQSRKLRTAGLIILAGLILGPLFTLFDEGLHSFYPFLNSLIIGGLIGVLISLLELQYFVKGARKLKFYKLVILRTTLYLVFITSITFLVLSISRVFRYDISYQQVLKSEEFNNLLFGGTFLNIIVYTLSIAFVINFPRQMNRTMGQGVLWGIITGKYHKPAVKRRIFMFLQIKESEKIVRKLGRLDFHRFLNDFVFDSTDIFLKYHGLIYQYVEDEIVISWEPEKGLRNANCLRVFFEIHRRINELKEGYYLKYSFVPAFKAAYHVGDVVVGEVGAVKSEISYYGDVMNTTSRILNTASLLNQDLLVSADLYKDLNIPDIYKARLCGNIGLKGKDQPLELYGINEIPVEELYEQQYTK